MSVSERSPAPKAVFGVPLSSVPIGLFTIVMGLGGLGLAWREAGIALGAPMVIGEGLLLLAFCLYPVIALLYGAKALFHPRAVVKEFGNPHVVGLFGAIPIGLMLLSVGALPHAPALAEALWLVGAPLQTVIAVLILRSLVTGTDLDPNGICVSWFVPTVGHVLAPMAGVSLGHVDASWGLWWLGVLLWMALLPMVLYRLFFGTALPGPKMPTVFILLAPPALCYLGLVKLNGGDPGPLGQGLFGLALVTTVLLATLAPRFLALPYSMGWWAFTFPSAAMAACALVHYGAMGKPWPLLVVAVACLAAATLILLRVASRSLLALARHLSGG